MTVVHDSDDLMLITNNARVIRIRVSGIPTRGRNTMGVRLIRVAEALQAIEHAEAGSPDPQGEAAAIATAANVELWKRATSLGGTESLIEHRASVEGAGTPAPADLLRLSVGIEDADDLIADLEQALAALAAP